MVFYCIEESVGQHYIVHPDSYTCREDAEAAILRFSRRREYMRVAAYHVGRLGPVRFNEEG